MSRLFLTLVAIILALYDIGFYLLLKQAKQERQTKTGVRDDDEERKER